MGRHPTEARVSHFLAQPVPIDRAALLRANLAQFVRAADDTTAAWRALTAAGGPGPGNEPLEAALTAADDRREAWLLTIGDWAEAQARAALAAPASP